MAVESNFVEKSFGKKFVVIEKDAQKRQEIENQVLKDYLKNLSEKERAEAKSLERIRKLREAGLDYSSELSKYNEYVKEREVAEKQLSLAKLSYQKDIDDKVIKYSTNAYKNLSIVQRREYSKQIVEKLNYELEFLKSTEGLHKEHIATLEREADKATGEDQERLKQQIKSEKDAFEARKKQLTEQKRLAEEAAQGFFKSNLSKAVNKLNDKTGINLNAEAARERGQEAGRRANEAAKPVIDHYKKQAELQKQILAAQLKGDKARVVNLKNEQAALEKQFKSSKEYEEAKASLGEATIEGLKEIGSEALDTLARGADNFSDTVLSGMRSTDKINANLDAIYGDQAKYIAKLQGSTEDWRESVDNVSDAIGFSGIVSKKNVITKMKDLVDSGIAYNIEMRAFLAETSANIASTFDATNGTLLRMIRLQQQDSTAARLGMEATLTRLFNDYFQDTTYLKDAADNISAAILDASATMNRDQSLEFEYTMQKWLGSLYSLGMSDQAVQSIATGINYLGTGNVSALNSNSALQTLLAMSASKAGGKSYADMLTTGLTSDDTNKLLKAMIEYLAEIAESQDNMVTKSAYAELFGMSVTDLSSFASLTTKEINDLYKNTVSYQDLMNETTTRLSQISGNMSLSDLVNNAIENAEVGVATTIGSNAFTYGTWKALGLLKDYVGEIKIPSVLAAGFGLSSDIDLINVAQTGMVGLGMIGSLLGGLGSMMSGGPTNLSNWDFNESTSRGGGLALLSSGSSSGKSFSAVIGTGSGSAADVESASLTSAKDKAYENSGTTSEEQEEQKEIPQKIYEALAGTESTSVISLLTEINDRIAPDRVFYTAIAGVLSTNAVEKVTNLSAQLSAAGLVNTNTAEERLDKAGTSNTGVISSNTLTQAALVTSEEMNADLSSIIQTAIESALSRISQNVEDIKDKVSYYGGSNV